MRLDIQKASMLKRISAGILDFILLVILSVGFAALISVISGYDKHINNYQNYLDEYAVQFGVDEYAKPDSDGVIKPSDGFKFFNSEEYNNLSEEEKKVYNNKVEAAYTALNNNAVAKKEYMLVMSLTLVMVSIGILLSYLILEFILPLLLKNGQTIGKKAFGIAVVHINGVKVNSVAMFIRTFLGKYCIETMIPVLIITMILFSAIGIVAFIVLGGILVLELFCLMYKKQRSLIHDVISKTCTVDLASQKIYDTEEEAIEAQRLAQYEEQSEYIPGTFSFDKTVEGKEIKKIDDNCGTDDVQDTCGTDDIEDITPQSDDASRDDNTQSTTDTSCDNDSQDDTLAPQQEGDIVDSVGEDSLK